MDKCVDVQDSSGVPQSGKNIAGKQETVDHREVTLLGICFVVYLFTLFSSPYLSQVGFGLLVYGLYFVPLVICGWSVLWSTWTAICRGDFSSESSLMLVAVSAAVIIDEVPEATAVMLLYRLGKFIQIKATDKSLASIKKLLATKPVSAHVFVQNELLTKPVEEVVPGDFIQVWAGEKIPLDGEVITGNGIIDQSPLTGESVPILAEPGKKLLGGSINTSGVLTIRVTHKFADTQMARILELVQSATTSKAPTERFITKFARCYTLVVFVLAILVTVVPPLLLNLAWHTWIYRALILLVISCPCALLISVPLSYFGGIGAAFKKGILIKSEAVFDDVSSVDTVVFDKTGTLTTGSFTVTAIVPAGDVAPRELLQAAMMAEQVSNHPIARCIRNYASEYGITMDGHPVVSIQELSGMGMIATVGEDRFLAGNGNLLKEFDIAIPPLVEEKNVLGTTIVHVARNKCYYGFMAINDSLKPNAAKTVAHIKEMGLKAYMLSGDKEQAASWVADELGLNGYWAELLPEGKVKAMQAITDASRTMFVGDGLNDAATLAHARVGVSLGQAGAKDSIETASVQIANDDIGNVEKLLQLSVRVRSIVWQNIFLALGVKTSIIVLSVVGLSTLWAAVFADAGVVLLTILNATRAIRKA